MESSLDLTEKRTCQRRSAMQRALVQVTHGPEALPFHIIDISQGGLSFRYLGKRLKVSEISEICLYHNQDLQLHNVPVKVVSDYRLRDSLVPVRRGSICFSSLSSEHQSQLESFIQSYSESVNEPD